MYILYYKRIKKCTLFAHNELLLNKQEKNSVRFLIFSFFTYNCIPFQLTYPHALMNKEKSNCLLLYIIIRIRMMHFLYSSIIKL